MKVFEYAEFLTHKLIYTYYRKYVNLNIDLLSDRINMTLIRNATIALAVVDYAHIIHEHTNVRWPVWYVLAT